MNEFLKSRLTSQKSALRLVCCFIKNALYRADHVSTKQSSFRQFHRQVVAVKENAWSSWLILLIPYATSSTKEGFNREALIKNDTYRLPVPVSLNSHNSKGIIANPPQSIDSIPSNAEFQNHQDTSRGRSNIQTMFVLQLIKDQTELDRDLTIDVRRSVSRGKVRHGS